MKVIAILTEPRWEESIRNTYGDTIVRCENCKHWADGNCLRAVTSRGEINPFTSRAQAFAGRYHASLITSADFFCADFEAKA